MSKEKHYDNNKKNEMKMFSLNEKYYSVLASLLTMMVFLLALSYGQMLGGKYSFITGDFYMECAPFAHLLVKKIRDGGALFYSFNVGLGSGTALLFAFYACSPFNVLYLFSNGNNINEIAIAVVTLKVGMAALSFQLYSKYNLGIKNVVSVIFAMGYALASYGLVSLDMTALYDGIYLLPLIICAIKYLIESKKTVLLTLLYTILFISNFYSGFIVGIFSFLYFVFHISLVKRAKKSGDIIFKYVYSVFCSFALSAIIIAPALFEALQWKVVDENFDFSSVPLWNIISYGFPFHTRKLYDMTPYYYCGLPAILLVGAFFTNSNIKLKYKLVCMLSLIVVILSMLCGPLYFAAHMFNTPNGYTFRYAYIISFILLSMGMVALKNIDGINLKKSILVNSVLVFVYIFSIFIGAVLNHNASTSSVIYSAIAIVMITLWHFIFASYINYNGAIVHKKPIELAIIVLFLCSFELCLNSYVVLTSEERYSAEDFAYKTKQTESIAAELSKIQDSAYRVHFNGAPNPNQACLYNYYGSNIFITGMNNDLCDFLMRVGLLCNSTNIASYGTSDLVQVLLAEKYNVDLNDDLDESYTSIYNENSIPGFGFMVDEGLESLTLGNNVFENQNMIYSVMLGSQVRPYSIYDGEVAVTEDNVIFEIGEKGEISFELTRDSEGGELAVKIPKNKASNMYAWLSTGYNSVSPWSPVLYSEDDGEWSGYLENILSAPHIVKMSEENDWYTLYVLLLKNIVSESKVTEFYFASYDDRYIEQLCNKLQEQSFNVTSIEDGLVVGNITVKQPGICFVSIPYEEGWSAIVDGENVPITPVFNGAFIGVPLKEGSHNVELCFNAPYSNLGKWISLFGIVLLIVMIFSDCGKLSKN